MVKVFIEDYIIRLCGPPTALAIWERCGLDVFFVSGQSVPSSENDFILPASERESGKTQITLFSTSKSHVTSGGNCGHIGIGLLSHIKQSDRPGGRLYMLFPKKAN